MAKKATVESMFNEISGRYDLLNHLLSFGVDFYWRKKFVSVLGRRKPLLILDVATGTGDLAMALTSLPGTRVVGIDIAERMIGVGKNKVEKRGLSDRVTLQLGDAENIPFPDYTFDAVTVAFGVRNYETLELGLTEMKRILKPGGTMQILEFSHPKRTPFRQCYHFYSRYIIPFIGRMVSRNASAYTYLPESIAKFPSGADFIEIMEKVGLENNSYISLTFGVATIYSGEKPAN